jgi:hypothetical protein
LVVDALGASGIIAPQVPTGIVGRIVSLPGSLFGMLIDLIYASTSACVYHAANAHVVSKFTIVYLLFYNKR